MLDLVLKNPWVRALGVLLALLLISGIVYLLLPILTALLFSFLVAYILAPVVNYAERRRIPRMAAIMALLIILLIAATALPVYLTTNVIHEAERLITRAHEGITEEYLDHVLDALPLRKMVHYLGWVPDDSLDFNEREVIIERLGGLVRDNALQLLRHYGLQMANMGREAGRSAAQILTSLGTWSLGIIAFLINVSLFVFVSVYLLRDYDALIDGARELAPPRYRPHLDAFMHKIDLQMRSLLRGQLTVCAALVVMYGIGLHWADAPFAFPIALFGGAASIIPYVGPMMTLAPAVLLTLLFYGIGSHLFWVFAIFIIVQSVESYFLTPKILGSKIGLNPVWVIVAFMVFSTALGFKGVILAMPLAAVLKVIVMEGATYYRQSRFFDDSSRTSNSSSGATS